MTILKKEKRRKVLFELEEDLFLKLEELRKKNNLTRRAILKHAVEKLIVSEERKKDL